MSAANEKETKGRFGKRANAKEEAEPKRTRETKPENKQKSPKGECPLLSLASKQKEGDYNSGTRCI